MSYVELVWREVPVSELTGKERGFVILPSSISFEADDYARHAGVSYASVCGSSTVRNRAWALRGTQTAMVVSHV